ncbi:MAG: hypothetical protein JXB49_02970 [Bacteroidales bacterium]|nr:hypothetical protein [Bacteroidales bacterium]
MVKFLFNKISQFYIRMRYQNQEIHSQNINNELNRDISLNNIRRTRYFLPFALFFFVSQIVNDFIFPDIWSSEQLYFFRINDIIAFILTLILLLFIFLGKNDDSIKAKRRNDVLVHIYILLILIYSASISSGEQYEFHHTPTFTITSLIVAILYFVPGNIMLIYLLIGLLVLTVNPYRIFVDNSVVGVYNSVSFIVAPIALIISRMLMFSKKESFLDKYYLAQAKDDLEHQVLERTQELHDANANLQNRIMVQLEYEKILEKAKLKAEESDRLKSAFLANLSHEIRTPMNAIVGFTELLIRSVPENERASKYSNILRGRSLDLLKIMDDIIVISKIESDQLEIFPEKVNVSEVFDTILTHAKQKLISEKKDNIELVCNYDLDEEPPILTDKLKFEQVLENLLDNAIKFTTNGKIELGCKLNNNGELQFYVSDTGIGISSDTAPIVFDKFRQIEQGLNRKYDGMGLGLSICKAFVEKQGGRIWLNSLEGKGTTVSFVLNQADSCNDITEANGNSEEEYDLSGSIRINDEDFKEKPG